MREGVEVRFVVVVRVEEEEVLYPRLSMMEPAARPTRLLPAPLDWVRVLMPELLRLLMTEPLPCVRVPILLRVPP